MRNEIIHIERSKPEPSLGLLIAGDLIDFIGMLAFIGVVTLICLVAQG